MEYIISYDLGTGGLKSTLYNKAGEAASTDFKSYETFYPAADFREQKPEDWWMVLKSGTGDLLSKKAGINVNDIVACAISGHSLGVVPIGCDGRVLAEFVPIWSDTRAGKQAGEVFAKIDEVEWYQKTGGGFPPMLYSAFKILWYKENMPEMYEKTDRFIGTKDYLNFRLTGVLATDHSYAAGSAVYDLLKCGYDRDYIKAFNLLPEKFPEPVESHEIIGTIKPEAAEELGLPKHLIVAAGGVDISCMAAGAGCIEDGAAYTNLGTSAWVSVISHTPVINVKTKPYVFGCLSKGMYNSSESIFSAGNTHRWVRNTICPDLLEQEKAGGEDAYTVMERLAAKSKPGANGLLFVPTLAGANALDRSLNAKGAILGLELRHTRGDIVQAALEGICLGLRRALDELQKMVPLSGEMLIVGGGARSACWRQLFADIYGLDIITSAVGENAGSLGAMACAAIGAGLWKDYTPLKALNKPVNRAVCNGDAKKLYESIYRIFRLANDQQSDIGDYRVNNFSGIA
jgi:xylulokinase